MATKDSTGKIEIVADCAVYSTGRSVFCASVTEPWEFKRELRQQLGKEDELGSVVLALAGQQACV